MTKDKWLTYFGSNLESLMREKNVTQTELAKASKISQATINRYLTGDRFPNTKAIINLSYALGCDLMDLIDFGEMID